MVRTPQIHKSDVLEAPRGLGKLEDWRLSLAATIAGSANIKGHSSSFIGRHSGALFLQDGNPPQSQ